jgi:cytoskeleton-associated protein 5
MTDCLRSFGAKVIKVSPLLKAVVPLLDHRDKPVRDEGKALIVEAYRWVGEIMKQQLTGCKPVQVFTYFF